MRLLGACLVLVAVLVSVQETCARRLNLNKEIERITDPDQATITREYIHHGKKDIELIIEIVPTKGKGHHRKDIEDVEIAGLAQTLDDLLNIIISVSANINNNDALDYTLTQALEQSKDNAKIYQAVESLAQAIAILKGRAPEPGPVPQAEKLEEPFLEVLVQSLSHTLKVKDSLIGAWLRPFNIEGYLDEVIVKALTDIANAGPHHKKILKVIGKAYRKLKDRKKVYGDLLSQLNQLYQQNRRDN